MDDCDAALRLEISLFSHNVQDNLPEISDLPHIHNLIAQPQSPDFN